MKIRNYILDERGNPVVEPDIVKWARWFDGCRNKRIVKQEYVGEAFISTVFIGIDHSWEKGPPLLWETMVFPQRGKWKDSEMDRCSGSREQAEAMHQKMVEKVKKEQTPLDKKGGM